MNDVSSNDTIYIITDNSYAYILQKGDEEDVKPGANQHQCDIFYNYPTSSSTFPVFRSAHPIPKDSMADPQQVSLTTTSTDKLEKLRNSTKQLLCLIEELQSKTHSSNNDDSPKLTNNLRKDNQISLTLPPEEIVSSVAVKTLEIHTKTLDDIYLKDKDDCSVYKRLTRECHCLNNTAYNDFIIHFNEDTKYITTTRGEIIKNMKIIKKFLYMGGKYTKNALTFLHDDKDDCSVYKRLTRECHCLNNTAYNDFIIHFNEDTKYITTTRGEIIKNMKIIKKFLYMGGKYTKNALTFLHDGLMNSQHSERLEIVQACVYADICNVFDDRSMVTVCILLPEMYETYGDSSTQKMAANILAQLILVEEGRRYLTFSSKITSDIKRLLKRKSSSFGPELIESLNLILSSLNPTLTRNINVSYYMKGQEGSGYRTLQTLSRYKMYLTVDEITLQLELLHSLSQQEEGKKELLQNFDLLLKVFKEMLLEFDISELNIAVTNILINLMTQSKAGDAVFELPKSYVVSEISTEPVRMISEVQQAPSPRKKSPRRTFGSSANRVPVLIKVPENNWSNSRYIDKPTKGFRKCSRSEVSKSENKGLKSSVIIIPVEKFKRINKA